LEADVVQLDFEDVPVIDFLDTAVTAAKLVASGIDKQITFTMDVAPGGLKMTVDSERLHQVAANLLSNAIRHSPEGGVIALKAAVTGRWIQLDVADQGPGIPVEDRERVFERFQRGQSAQSSNAQSTGGTGLGLAIARWAVRLHAGTLDVVDTEVGCTMRVRIPKTLPTK
jgi:signal transduction histidine kinase